MTTVTPYRSPLPAGGDGFAHLVRAELTKFRTVRGWLIACGVAAVLMVAFAVLAAAGTKTSGGGGQEPPRGPDGTPVADRFTFVHQPLDGDGTLTVRVASLVGSVTPAGPPPDGAPAAPAAPPAPVTGEPEPWAKAGLMVKSGTTPGAGYAAIMVTGGHGVRMQHDFTHDVAGPATARWLRLTRTGGTVTGYASDDGASWTEVGSARVEGSTVAAGLFVASPAHEEFEQFLGGTSSVGAMSTATAVFAGFTATGTRPGGTWATLAVGADDDPRGPSGGATPTGDGFEVTGSGDVAPLVTTAGPRLEHTLVGGFAALTVVVVVGVLFVTSEYRRGMLRTSLAASPRRGRVLAAKALVIGAVTFVVGLAATVAALMVGRALLDGQLASVATGTQVRLVVGTAAVLAVSAVFATAVGTVLRRGAGAVAAVVVLTSLPYILATAAVLPAGPADWVLRVTPAAAFAVQQTATEFPQVHAAYTPAFGFFPLAPWAGFAVLCAWTSAALAAAAVLLRRRDA